MARKLVKLTGADIVTAVAYVRDDARPLVGAWLTLATGEDPRSGDRHDPAFANRFAAQWVRPGTVTDLEWGDVQPAYAKSVLAHWNGGTWRSLIDVNVWEPGVANWRAVPGSGEPADASNRGAWDSKAADYLTHDIVTHLGLTFTCLQGHKPRNNRAPGSSPTLWVVRV